MAAPTISEMVEKGKKSFARKIGDMKANYDAAKGKMKTSYNDLPFGPRTKAAC